MSAMRTAKTTEIELTVRKLRAYLDALESEWTAEDRKFLGEFNDQKINVPYFNGCDFGGYGPAAITYDGGLDFIIDQPKS